MKRAELQQIVRYGEALYEVVAIGEGRSVTLRPVKESPCPRCGVGSRDAHLLEHSPLFQDRVTPVDTISSEGQG